MTKEEMYKLNERDLISHLVFGLCKVTNVVEGVGLVLEPQSEIGKSAMRESLKRNSAEEILEANAKNVEPYKEPELNF